MTKRSLPRLDTSPATSDVATCRHCQGPVTARKAYRLGGGWQSRPVCPRCQTFPKPCGKRHVPQPRVVVVRRADPPAEPGTGLRAKLRARCLPTWPDRQP